MKDCDFREYDKFSPRSLMKPQVGLNLTQYMPKSDSIPQLYPLKFILFSDIDFPIFLRKFSSIKAA